MSGLWSFRDNTLPSPSLNKAVKSCLPTAVDDSNNDDGNNGDCFVENINVEHSSLPLEDAVKTFGTTVDVDEIVKEVQNEWVERTLGLAKTSSYHLLRNQQDTSNNTNQPTGEVMVPTPVYEPLDEEDMTVLRSLLNLHTNSGQKKKAHTRPRKSCPTVPKSPILHTAELASRREKQQNFSNGNDTENSIVTAESEQDISNKTHIPKGDGSSKNDGTSKYTESKTRTVPKPIISCTFVDRMEERAKQRREARAALETARRREGTTDLLPITHCVVRMRGNEGEKMTSSFKDLQQPETSFHHVFPGALVSTEKPLDSHNEKEAMSRQWNSMQRKKLVWRRWSHVYGNRSGIRKSEKILIQTNISGSCSSISDTGNSVFGSLQSLPSSSFSLHEMQLLRWYFVVWASVLENISSSTRTCN
ncbi:uncharacterized protein TM35_000074150 [Trypanosoma theileri]|uniref:Uncharacterized protein n=1 Tax=Trypanosoma theileri TaxID=67003 RepID=A0A1X0P2A4_9TRYP|nr:uncharacterized protein TM35_000074150 [Trypanosoma theileri]ORC90991.1 hypothetical protein TM35_000074150 [Trypanosoma theileri]